MVGAAVATSIGRTTGVLYQLYRLTRGDGRLTVRMRHVRLEATTMLSVLRLSGAGTLQTVVGMTSWIFLVRIISRFGSEAVAGYTIAIRLIIFALLPSFGLANAAATLVGQNLGAKKPDRAEQAAWKAGHVGAVFLGTVGLVFIAPAPHIVGIFTGDPLVLAHGVRGLRIISAGFAFYAYGMTFTQALNGAGATWAPTWLNGLCFWAFELPLAWVLAVHVGLADHRRVHRLPGRVHRCWRWPAARSSAAAPGSRSSSDSAQRTRLPGGQTLPLQPPGGGLETCAPLSCARPCLVLRRAQRGDALILLGQGITSFRPAGRSRSCRAARAPRNVSCAEAAGTADTLAEVARVTGVRQHPRRSRWPAGPRR